MWVYETASLRILEVNQAALVQYGYTREEFLQLTKKDLLDPVEISGFMADLNLMIDSRQFTRKRTHRRKDGSTFETQIVGVFFKQKGIDSILVLATDLSSNNLQQNHAQEREAMLDALGDNLHGGAVYQLLQTPGGEVQFSYFSKGFERIFGFRIEDVISSPNLVFDHIHPDDLPLFQETQSRSFREYIPFNHEFRQRNRQGQWKWVHCLSAPRRLANGLVAWDGVVMEITKRKEAEQLIRQQSEILQSLGDNLPGGCIFQYIIEPGTTGNYTYISTGIELISEIRAEDLLSGKARLRGLFPEKIAKRIQEAQNTAVDEVNILEDEFPVKLPSGNERVWHVRTAIRRRVDDAIVWNGVILDVTDRRQFESQLAQVHKYQTISVLAGGIAHDFNNLLTGMLGFAELAQMEIDTEHPAQEYLKEIFVSAKRAAELCQQMLAYAGRGKIQRGPIDLSFMVKEASGLLRTVVSKKAEIQLNLTEPMMLMEGDPTQMRQVILNLLTNASEALGDKPGIIAIRTGVMFADASFFSTTVLRPELPPGKYVYIEVEDTGCGMSAETKSRIFEPFFTTKFSGRGLGLAALLGIVGAHRGAIRVTSDLGRGSIFRICFPMVEGLSTPVVETPRGISRLRLGNILIIDDEETIRRVCQTTLEKSGYTLSIATNGNEGFEIFRNAPDSWTLVITDLTMPGMDGLETVRAIHAIQPHQRVVLMSGYSEVEVQQRFGDYGFSGFVQKPFSPTDLVAMIDRICTPS